MGTRVQEPRVEKHWTEKGSYGSQSSYVSALDFQEPAMSKSHAVVETKTVQEPTLSLTVSEPVVPKADETGMQKPVEPFVPRPPPGPPPPSPPRMLNQGYGLGNVTRLPCRLFQPVCQETCRTQVDSVKILPRISGQWIYQSCRWTLRLCNSVTGSASSILSWATCPTEWSV